jgi:RNA binding exosome subunit
MKDVTVKLDQVEKIVRTVMETFRDDIERNAMNAARAEVRNQLMDEGWIWLRKDIQERVQREVTQLIAVEVKVKS